MKEKFKPGWVINKKGKKVRKMDFAAKDVDYKKIRQNQAKTWNTQCPGHNRMGDQCKLPAGFATDHPGQGMCKYHGGMNPILHGRYSKYNRNQLKVKFDEFMNDPDFADLHDEIAQLRALVAHTIDTKDIDNEKILGALTSMIDAIGKMTERRHKIKHGDKLSIDVKGLTQIINQVVYVINKHVPDATVRKNIAEDIRGLKL